MAPRKEYNDGTRVQALALLSQGLKLAYISSQTGLDKSTISRIGKKAKERGYDHKKDPVIYKRYVEDAPR
ncbi:hypothetical protein BJ875DRAFT_464974 [Amylocarpus encephaloides]|uniref:Uncharacterized protein n=1 Tax=Amylocarpus encephaloides TaxID=45428 RepID=A0A9P8C406_9HELO|nr:hypothetical protein BJ875DRAFT_464974 [Amylocarpus encephaloides]